MGGESYYFLQLSPIVLTIDDSNHAYTSVLSNFLFFLFRNAVFPLCDIVIGLFLVRDVIFEQLHVFAVRLFTGNARQVRSVSRGRIVLLLLYWISLSFD